MTERYALYFAPAPDSALANFGKEVLGRTHDKERQSNSSSSFTDRKRWMTLTEKPAHYGFHATLKAPFELESGTHADELFKAVYEYASLASPLPLSGLAPRRLSGFLALTLGHQSQAFSETIQTMVETFEPFRKALSESDRQRRLSRSLTPRQIELLDQFGYPLVAEEFRFHMTLSAQLNDLDRDYQPWVQQLYDKIVGKEPELNRIAIYHQNDRNSAFVEWAHFPFPVTN